MDPITRDALQEMIKGLQQEMKKTIVFVTHDMDEAIKLADKIIIMDHGEIVQYDTVDTILEKPANDFVEELIGKRKRNGYYNNEMTVSDLMVDRVESISLSKSITEAIRQMSEKKVDTLLVVDDQNCLKGFIDINFVERNISKLKPTSSVFEVMRTDTASVNQKDRVAYVIEPLINHVFKYLPVVDDEEHLVGIVTRSSLVSLVQEQLQ